MIKKILLIILLLIQFIPLNADKETKINWISFEQLEDSLAVNPKKVFIDFYTDWCAYCKKMDNEVFTKQEVIEKINQDYYAVRFDAESVEVINFAGRKLINNQVGKSRKPIHQIAQLLATRDGAFSAPALLFLDKDFNVVKRHFEYLDSKKLLKALIFDEELTYK